MVLSVCTRLHKTLFCLCSIPRRPPRPFLLPPSWPLDSWGTAPSTSSAAAPAAPSDTDFNSTQNSMKPLISSAWLPESKTWPGGNPATAALCLPPQRGVYRQCCFTSYVTSLHHLAADAVFPACAAWCCSICCVNWQKLLQVSIWLWGV